MKAKKNKQAAPVPSMPEIAKITAQILDIKRDRHIQDGVEFLDVEVALLEEGKKKPLEVRKYGYALETSKEQIREDLKKVVAEFVESRARSVEQAKADAADANAEQTKDMIGETIS